jgi:phage terminase large subunit GpA-like protein
MAYDLDIDPADLGLAGAAMLRSVIAAVTPPVDQTIAQWAEGRVVIPAEANTPRPGPISFEGFEYCIEPLNRLHYDDPCTRVTCVAAAQSAKSNIGVVWCAWTICVSPRPIGVAVPSGPKAYTLNSKKLQPVIDKTPELAELVVPQNSRDERASTTRQKNYPGGSLTIFSAGSVNDLQMESFGAIWLTESPNFLADVGGRGSPVTQARARMDGWEKIGTKELHESTPGEEGACPVSADYDAGDRRLWYMPCPHCSDWCRWEWEDFTVPEDPGDAPFVTAPCCGGVVAEPMLPAMRRQGVWIATFPSQHPANPAPGTAFAAAALERWRARDTEGREPSYRWWQIVSPLKTWRGIAKDWRDAKGKPAEEAAFRQQKLALPTETAAKAPDHVALAEAAAKFAHPRGQVPPWACYLTGAADIQGDRIEWATYAHGPRGMARIDRGVIELDPLGMEAWSELAKVTQRRWDGPHVRALGMDAFAVDSGGQDGVTPRVYEFTRNRAGVYALKGTSGAIESGLPVEFKRIKGKDTRDRPITVEVLRVDGYMVKRFIVFGLQALAKSAEAGARQPGAIFFEDDATAEDFRQLTAEVFVRDVGAKPGKRGEWKRIESRANEQLDLAVYNWALAYQKRLHTWDDARWESEFVRRARIDGPAPRALEEYWSTPERPVADLPVNVPALTWTL